MNFSGRLLLWTCLTLLGPSFSQADPILERGTLDGAHYAMAQDDSVSWNGSLLLIAHGYRPDSAPLVADLFPEQLAYASLLETGWIVAKTSYRRNGIIVHDAIEDLDNLRAYVTRHHGSPTRVIIEGDSMGGTIATHLMERESDLYDGAVAVGAALDLRESEDLPGVTRQPLRPLLFLSNRSEIAGPLDYAKKARLPSTRPDLRPIVFRVDRDGHVNVNQAERLTALHALLQWLDEGRAALPSPVPFDATQPPPPQPSAVTFDPDLRGLTARVTHISAIYGNVWLNLQPHDLEHIGLASGTWFTLTIHDQTYRARYGQDFSSVARGEWVIFPNADGYFWLSRNWGDAAATAAIQLQDTVHLRRDPASPAAP